MIKPALRLVSKLVIPFVVFSAISLYQQPRPTISDVQRSINNVLSGIGDVLGLQQTIDALVAPCVYTTATVSISSDQSSFTLGPITMTLTNPVSGQVEIRFPDGVTPNFNLSFPDNNVSMIGEGWAMEVEGRDFSQPAVIVPVVSGKFGPPVFLCQ